MYNSISITDLSTNTDDPTTHTWQLDGGGSDHLPTELFLQREENIESLGVLRSSVGLLASRFRESEEVLTAEVALAACDLEVVQGERLEHGRDDTHTSVDSDVSCNAT